MRLTLRTLLAYRDGVLGPADSEDMHRRIQQSEDAGNLLKRIGKTCSRLQDSSPMIVGRGLGADPNSIAEYLDDSLPGEKVPELERICLESDSFLSELASCHTLLSTAMHTRVGVSDAMRDLAIGIGSDDERDGIREEWKSRKMQRGAGGTAIIQRVDASHSDEVSASVDDLAATDNAQQAVQVAAPMVASGGGTIKQHGLNLESSALAHEVPEYLVGVNKRNWRMPLAIGALVALLAVLIWQTLGPWDRVMGLFSASSPRALPGDLPRTNDQPSNASPGDTAAARDTAGAATRNGAPLAPLLPGGPVGSNAPEPSGVSPAASSPAASVKNGESETLVVPPGGSDAGSDASPLSDDHRVDGAARLRSTERSAPVPVRGAANWLPKNDSDRKAVLLTLDQGKLRRLASGDSLAAGKMLLVPPSFRTTIDLLGGVYWTTCGPSLLTIGEEADAALITTSLCRGLVRGSPSVSERRAPPAVPGSPGALNLSNTDALRIASPVGQYDIVLDGPGSMASVEVTHRASTHGSVLDQAVYRPMLLVIAVEGNVNVTAVGSQPAAAFKLTLGEGLAVVDDATPKKFILQSIPQWFRASFDRPIDALAAEDLEQYLVPGAGAVGKQSADSVLRTLTRHRRPETAALAVQTSLLAGRWEPLVSGFLSNDRMRSHWTKTLDLATQLLAADHENAKQVHALFSASSPEGETLFQMMCGLSGEQLSADGLSFLIGQLGAADLETRVLASYQLQRLTGKNLGFQPHAPNRASIQQWRRELATDRLPLLPRSDVIWERIPK